MSEWDPPVVIGIGIRAGLLLMVQSGPQDPPPPLFPDEVESILQVLEALEQHDWLSPYSPASRYGPGLVLLASSTPFEFPPLDDLWLPQDPPPPRPEGPPLALEALMRPGQGLVLWNASEIFGSTARYTHGESFGAGMAMFGSFLALSNVIFRRSTEVAELENQGSWLLFVPFTFGFATTLIEGDTEGFGDLLSVSALSTLATGFLKRVVHETRPNGNPHSFPSGHTTIAVAGAAFLQERYGWTYGVPAFAVASFVAYSRVRADKHWWHDVVAGAAVAIGIDTMLTEVYVGELGGGRLSLGTVLTEEMIGVAARIDF